MRLGSDTNASRDTSVGVPSGHLFLKEGEYWTICCDGIVVRLRDSKGLRYLAELLRHPGEYLAALPGNPELRAQSCW